MSISLTASLVHEALGHGLSCITEHGRITLLTFLVFRCLDGGVWTDGGGPIAVLIAGMASLILLHRLPHRQQLTRLWLLNFGTMSLLWACGQAISEAFDGSDDWGHVAHDLSWPTWWHQALGMVSLIGYASVVRWVMKHAEPIVAGAPGRLLIPYGSAMLSAIALGSLWHGARLASALDGFLSFGVAPMGYLLIARRWSIAKGHHPPQLPRATRFIALVAMLWLAFALTVARGIGLLA
ncbi:hypothetical protein ACYJW8_13310 [Frateuria aurantia]